ncbi:hypothetical protein OHA72_12390 [Dactylosporangium sp. NBC_01737]|nr:hypothetical protein OHA72_12390 [Dactylosporangium sp. NBC_01737]
MQSPGYRVDKAATALDLLPDLLAAQRGSGLRLACLRDVGGAAGR